MTRKMHDFKCNICRRKSTGFGNNSLPIVEGKCCDVCNDKIVVPFRIKFSYVCEQIKKEALEYYKKGENHED